MGVLIALGGIAMMVVGVIFLMHCDVTAPGFFGGTFCLVNLLQGWGILLLILGVVVMLIGLILPYATAPEPPQAPQMYVAAPVVYGVPAYPQAYAPAPGYPQQPSLPPGYPQQVAPPPAAPARACPKCGAAVAAQFCPTCGTQQW